MSSQSPIEKQLAAENAELRARLEDAEEMLRAIRAGEVDALVVENPAGPRIYTLQGLDAEDARFRGDILAQVSEAVLAIDEERRVTYINAAAEQQYGVRASEALGRNVSEIFENRWRPPDDEAAAVAAVRETGHWRGENLHVTRSGEAIHVETSLSLLPAEHGRAAGVLAVIRDITARHETEEALRLSEQRFRAAVSTVSSLIWTNSADGRMEGVQPGWSKFTGQTQDEYEGYGWAKAVHPDEAQATIDSWNQAVAEKRLFEFEHRVRRADGEWRVCSVRAVPLLSSDGTILEWVGVHTDITERRRHEEVLSHSEALFSTIIEQAPGGVYVVDDQFRTLRVNALARPAFAAAEPVIGRDLAEVMEILWGTELGGQLSAIFRHTLATGERYVSPRFTHERHDLGAEKSYDWEVQRLTLPNGRYGVVCYFTDTTDQYAQEKALLDAKRAAEAANASKDRFLAVLSHELRTPLTPVLMAVASLERDPQLPPAVREDFAMIRRNIELETKLIDDLLDLNRIASGKLMLEIETVDLNEIVQRVCSICQPELRERGVRLDCECSDAAGFVSADPARLQQLLWNVLRNAIKFTPEGGRIGVSTARLDNARSEVRVRDTGIGIPPEMLPRIFDAFEQGDGITRQFGGLGLGLAICKAIVDLHRGTIRAESDGPDQGASFIIELPCEAPPSHMVPSPSPSAEGATPERPRLLVVEDHADTAQALARLLRRCGYTVTIATDVASALAAAQREPFDILVSDLGLPDGTGNDLIRRLRKTCDVRGIAMSGFGMDEDLRRSREAGFSEHLVKPIDIPKLEAAIRRVMRRRP